ncbi:MAG: hypothetical protein IKH77_00490 [Clostridia bacterium]|nr:hypothetical protein [Clostridia bacterium]
MKRLLVVLAALLALLLCGAAQADRYPTNPYRQEDLALERRDWMETHSRATYWQKDFHLEVVTAPTYDTPGVFRIVKESTAPDATFTYAAQVYDDRLDDGDRLLYSLHNISGDTLTLPLLAMPATYRITLFAENHSNADESRSARYTFTLDPDADHPALSDKVAGIVNQCKVPGDDWQTALNLHDWLTHHARYDYTYTMYGPDGVLYKGTGVCDSYSKAYNLLLREAGIDVARVSSNPMNHAWNVVCIDDIWAHVDVTWDDPGESEGPVSGEEYHHFFCLSDAFIQDGRYHSTHHDYAASHACPSLANSAIVRLDEEWPEANTWQDEAGKTGTYTDLFQAQIDLGQTSFDVDLKPRLDAGDGAFYDLSDSDNAAYFAPKFHLLAMVQQYRSWQSTAGNAVTVAVTFNESDRVFHVEVTGAGPDPAPGYDICVLPESTESLGAEAFRGTAFREFVLPDLPVTVAADCFAGLTVDAVWITIPNAASVVDPDAFPAGITVTLIAPAALTIDGTPVETFCQQNGLLYLAP